MCQALQKLLGRTGRKALKSPNRYLKVPMPQLCAYFAAAHFCVILTAATGIRIPQKSEVPMMSETAKKYINLFRQVKIATAATVDAQGRPRR